MRWLNATRHPLVLCGVALAATWAALGPVRWLFQTMPEPVFGIAPLGPRHQMTDSWEPMARAYQYLRAPHDVPVYRQLFLNEHQKFQYPLSSLFAVTISQDAAVLNGISALAILLVAGLTVWTVRDHLRRGVLGDGDEDIGLAWPTLVALVLLMTFTFHPLVWAYRLGQIQVWLTLGWGVALLLWTRGRRELAGFVVGLLTLVKPQFGFLFVWGLLRRCWGFSLAGIASLLAGTLWATAVYGLSDTLDYLTVLRHLSQRGESYVGNQSVNGLLNRLVGHDLMLERELPPFHPLVYGGTVVTSVILMGLSLFGPIRVKGQPIDLFIASLTSVLAAPVAWRHHYSILLPVFGMLFVSAVRRPVWGRWTLPYLCACYAAIGIYQGTLHGLKDSWLNVLQSYTLFGGLGLLLYLYRLAREPHPQLRGGSATVR